ncbi:MAG: hypothetical protein FJ399_01040 [Verrucomicrobia bacterium]|nr:hypothetical protein [Verrucomicrobiota bacterium]
MTAHRRASRQPGSTRGEPFENFDTQSPWVTREIAYPFRFLKQRVATHRDLTVLDTLYMLERAAER